MQDKQQPFERVAEQERTQRALDWLKCDIDRFTSDQFFDDQRHGLDASRRSGRRRLATTGVGHDSR